MMNDRSQPGCSNFGPRLKVANGLEGRFRSKPMLKIGKECQKYEVNMKYMNLCNRSCNVNDQQTNVSKQVAKKNPTKDSDVGPSNTLVAENSKSQHSRVPTTLSLENSLNLSPMGLKCPKTSRVRNLVPAEKMKIAAPSKSTGDSNGTSRCLEQPQHMKTKDSLNCSIESSYPTHFKAMTSLVHKLKDVGTSNLNNGALGSHSKSRSNPYRGEDINVGDDGMKRSKSVKMRKVSRKSNTPTGSGLLVANNDDLNTEKERQDEVVTKEKEMVGRTSEGCATSDNGHKQMGVTRTDDAPNSSPLLVGKKHVQSLGNNLVDNSSRLVGKNHSRLQRSNASFMESSNCARVPSKHGLPETDSKLPNKVQLVGGNGKTNDGKCRRKQPFLEEKHGTHGGIDGDIRQDLTCTLTKSKRCIEDNEGEEEQMGTYKPKKKQRKYIETSKYKDEMCDQHRVPGEDGTGELMQAAISKHPINRQFHCCSKPIDEPIWSVTFKIDGKKYISLAGHFSTKSCKKVRNLSLRSTVQVTKVPRLAAWPNVWKSSKPTGDSIGIYFFPHEMRHDEELEQLVKEVMDKDLILQAVIDDAEMLVFPSVLLPERHQIAAFQTKHYLWAAFKAKEEDKGAVIVEQEEDNEKHHVSNQLDEVQSEEPDPEMILIECAKPLDNQQLPAKSNQEVETCCFQGPTSTRFERGAPEERRLREPLCQAVCTSASTAVATDATTVANVGTAPSEAASFATNVASFPANHGPVNPSMEARPCSSTVLGIFVTQTSKSDPKVQEFIQEMERHGKLLAVMQGEGAGASQWPSNITTAMQ